MSNKQIERICKNCKIYNAKTEECSVVVLYEGKRLKVPMSPEDKCLYETEYFDPTTKSIKDFAEDIQEVKFWLENEKGQKVGKKKWWQIWKSNENTVVKIEYPQGFFGKEKEIDDID
jgi:hypothetical protein